MPRSPWTATFPRTDRSVDLTRHVNLGIVIPLVVLAVVIVAGYIWYRRSMARMRPDETKPISGVRLTAEALHRESPPWRVVYEIGGTLGGVDHVIIGPAGIIAITTVVADRPSPERLRETSTVGQGVLGYPRPRSTSPRRGGIRQPSRGGPTHPRVAHLHRRPEGRTRRTLAGIITGGPRLAVDRDGDRSPEPTRLRCTSVPA
jgi:hypothetical protein